MNGEAKDRLELSPQGRERIDLAVYAYRVLAVLRPLDPIECDAVLHAALELNRPARIDRSPPAPSLAPDKDEG